MDGEAWWAAAHGVAQSRTRLKRLSSSSTLSQTLVSTLSRLSHTDTMKYVVTSHL